MRSWSYWRVFGAIYAFFQPFVRSLSLSRVVPGAVGFWLFVEPYEDVLGAIGAFLFCFVIAFKPRVE